MAYEHLAITWPLTEGDDEDLVVTFIESDGTASVMTGRTFACEIRQITKSSSDAADLAAGVAIVGNVVTASINNAQTRTLFASGFQYFYDFQQVLAGKKLTLVGGPITIKRDSTT